MSKIKDIKKCVLRFNLQPGSKLESSSKHRGRNSQSKKKMDVLMNFGKKGHYYQQILLEAVIDDNGMVTITADQRLLRL